MQLTNTQLAALKARDGAGSPLTKTEYEDAQLTVVEDEKRVIEQVISPHRIFQKEVDVQPDDEAARVTFVLYYKTTEVGVVRPKLQYPKEKKKELRLYLTEETFFPDKDSMWYVFIRNDGKLCLGWCTPDEFHEMGSTS